ncbi:phosphate transport system permease protein [Roseimicrobium gellanilyticum]|uniref:Phosphate transport system permease protein PstA n=1 Tax=Roseimicrobium gellanilyticum TaxID=748857 RepID=A0A366HSI5_9BACT|nr:phosphate ABC transporter permease PstA [Roseimicrobium gellanilyticum]RBP47236.1 phosphate transport system permease protein [Roseimicrobium gellanilyticum]
MHAPANPSTSGVIPNPFARPKTNKELYEFLWKQVLRAATYAILVAVFFIFGHILIKGAPVVFGQFRTTSSFPYVANDFLTKLPETLHVLEDKQGNKYETDPKGSDVIKAKLGDNLRSEKTISYSGGGILGPIVGTVLLVAVCIVVALFLGISSAVYLSEYAKHGRFIEIVRLAILNLSGVPSVVFGLFGLGIFVLSAPVFTDVPLDRSLLVIPLGFTKLSFQGWDACVMSGAFTLAFVILPVIITASEECLRAVPQGFRETSLALGATRWQTIWKSVLPFAMPGILTSSILGIARAAGETAPIMFTAALAFKDKLPWQNDGAWPLVENPGWMGEVVNGSSQGVASLTESVQALPYHIYTIAARIPQSEYSERAQYGSVFVFLVIVLAFATASVLLRRKLRAKYKW